MFLTWEAAMPDLKIFPAHFSNRVEALSQEVCLLVGCDANIFHSGSPRSRQKRYVSMYKFFFGSSQQLDFYFLVLDPLIPKHGI